MFKSIFFACYSALWSLALPIFKRHKKLADGYFERCGYLSTGQKYAEACDLMLVAASAGEAYLALEIIEELAKSGQKLKILVNTWTRQGLDILKNNSQNLLETAPQIQVQFRFAFFDQPKIVKKVLQECTPKLIVLLETEIWFALLEQAKIQSIKVAIINARLSPKSLKYLSLCKNILASPECIMSTSLEDQERFAKLFKTTKLALMPNIKFDRSYKLLQANLQENHKTNELKPYQDYILFASVREEEESLLVKSMDWLLANNSQMNIIIAPRHISRLEFWKNVWQNREQVQVFLASKPQNLAAKNIIIWDRFGELPRLYASAKAIYVGGSLVDLGGQNFLESSGKKICLGKYLKNFAWAIDDELMSLGIIEIVDNEMQLALSLNYDYQHSAVQKQAEFFAWLAQKGGGTKQSVLYILEHL